VTPGATHLATGRFYEQEIAMSRYDRTVALVAGHIAVGLVGLHRYNLDSIDTDYGPAAIARYAVDVARCIVAEVARTEPAPPPDRPATKVYE
jgi:hypothetical protein